MDDTSLFLVVGLGLAGCVLALVIIMRISTWWTRMKWTRQRQDRTRHLKELVQEMQTRNDTIVRHLHLIGKLSFLDERERMMVMDGLNLARSRNLRLLTFLSGDHARNPHPAHPANQPAPSGQPTSGVKQEQAVV